MILIGTLSKYCRQITQLGLGPGRPPALLPPVPRKRETLLAFGFCRFAFRNYRILAIRSSRSRRRARIAAIASRMPHHRHRASGSVVANAIGVGQRRAKSRCKGDWGYMHR